jgi:gas vesicle protein
LDIFDIMDIGKTIFAFMAGAAAGAAVALLLAPDSGEKTREKIRSKAADAVGTAKEKILEGLDAVETVLEEE